ncbi:MAG: DciA family protein [Gammaproteobacteria bacterium]
MTPNQNKTLSIQSVLNSGSEGLSALCAHASRIANIQQILCTELGPPLSEHLSIANFRHRTLIIHADSPAWATRLRFNAPHILKIAQTTCGLTGLCTVRVKVFIPENDYSQAKRKISLSDNSARTIRKLAKTTTSTLLRAALFRLSKQKS